MAGRMSLVQSPRWSLPHLLSLLLSLGSENLQNSTKEYWPFSLQKQATEHLGSSMTTVRKLFRGFPGGSVVKNLPANPRDTGSILDPGRSNKTWAAEPTGNYWAWSHNYWTHVSQLLKPVRPGAHALWEAPAMSSPCTATREKPQRKAWVATNTQHSQK